MVELLEYVDEKQDAVRVIQGFWLSHNQYQNTISVRKDFPGYEYEVVRRETIYGEEYEIRRDKQI